MRNGPRLVQAILTRKGAYIWKRNYTRVQTAIRRATELAFIEGQPGDVIELSHAATGMQIGTIKLHVGDRITTQWTIWARGEAFPRGYINNTQENSQP